MYKVLIADDEEIIRRGIAHFLKKDPDIQAVSYTHLTLPTT